MNISKFDINKAQDGHNGTIKSHEVLPESWAHAPFKTSWGYLSGRGQMEGHTHPEYEIYMIFKGKGIVTVESDKAEVIAGDIVEIPAGKYHVMENQQDEELLWAAFWWKGKT